MTIPIKFTTQVQERFIEQPQFLYWRGRILMYNGQVDMGKKHIKQALNSDPDNKVIVKFWKELSKMDKLKEQGNEEFKAGNFKEAIELYEECLQFDQLNATYNQTILFNRASTY